MDQLIGDSDGEGDEVLDELPDEFEVLDEVPDHEPFDLREVGSNVQQSLSAFLSLLWTPLCCAVLTAALVYWSISLPGILIPAYGSFMDRTLDGWLGVLFVFFFQPGLAAAVGYWVIGRKIEHLSVRVVLYPFLMLMAAGVLPVFVGYYESLALVIGFFLVLPGAILGNVFAMFTMAPFVREA